MNFDVWDGVFITLMITRIVMQFVHHGKPQNHKANGFTQFGVEAISFFLLYKAGMFL